MVGCSPNTPLAPRGGDSLDFYFLFNLPRSHHPQTFVRRRRAVSSLGVRDFEDNKKLAAAIRDLFDTGQPKFADSIADAPWSPKRVLAGCVKGTLSINAPTRLEITQLELLAQFFFESCPSSKPAATFFLLFFSFSSCDTR